MDKIFEGNIYSKIIHNYLPKYEYDDPQKEGILRNEPNNYVKFHEFQPEPGFDQLPNADSRYRFRIMLESGFLKNLVIKSYMTCEGDNSNLATGFAAYLWNEITIKQGFKQLTYHGRSYIMSRVQEYKTDKVNDILYTMYDPTWINNQVIIYTPIFCFFTDYDRNNLLLDVNKELEVEIKWANFQFDSPLTAFEVRLGVTQRIYDTDYMSRYISSYKNKSWIGYDILLLRKIAPGGSTSVAFDVDNKSLCNAIMAGGFFESGNVVSFTKMDIILGGILAQSLHPKDMVYLGKTSSRFYESIMYYFGSHKRDGFYGGLDLSMRLLRIVLYFDELPESAEIELNLETFKEYKSDSKGLLESNALLH